MTDESTVLNNLRTAHYGDWGLDLTSQAVHELWAEIEARDERIAEPEAAQARWIPVSERLPKESGWYRVGATDVFCESYTDEVYFDANKTELGWHTCSGNVIYCWLDGVPELPKPPEVK